MGAFKKFKSFFSLFDWQDDKGWQVKDRRKPSAFAPSSSSFNKMKEDFSVSRQRPTPEADANRSAPRLGEHVLNLSEPFDDPRGYVIALINDKGGVGKTTTAVNLAAALAVRADVLLIDLDRQASATIALGKEPERQPFNTIAGVFEAGFSIETIIQPSGIDRVDFIPSGLGMTFVENKLQNSFNTLRTALEPLRKKYRYILLDCSPTFTSLSANALTAADGCIVPVSLDHLAVAGIESLTSTFEYLNLAEDKLAPLVGIVVTMADHQHPATAVKLSKVRNAYGDLVFDSVVQFDKQLAEAPATGKSIFDYAGGSRGARCYWSLSKEVITRCRKLVREVKPIEKATEKAIEKIREAAVKPLDLELDTAAVEVHPTLPDLPTVAPTAS